MKEIILNFSLCVFHPNSRNSTRTAFFKELTFFEIRTIEVALLYYEYPREDWWYLRTNNPRKRLIREIRRRTRAVGAFPDRESAVMLARTSLRHAAGPK